jgi:hypothetical protein
MQNYCRETAVCPNICDKHNSDGNVFLKGEKGINILSSLGGENNESI